MANRRLNNIDLDQNDSSSDSENDEETASDEKADQPSTVPKASNANSQRNVANNSFQTDDNDEVVSPRKNLHSVVLSDDEEEHIVRLDLHQQAHDEKLERMVNLGVAERRRPIRDRMHTVSKLVDGHLIYSVEPADGANSTAAPTEKQADCDNVSDQDSESDRQADKNMSRGQKKVYASDQENSEDREFIVSDSATPSYHESAASSNQEDSSDEAAVDQTNGSSNAAADAAAGTDRGDCQCHCNCPACRRCEFKCRKRWLRKKAKLAWTDHAKLSTDDDSEAGDGNRGGACASRKRHSKRSSFSLQNSDIEDEVLDNDEHQSYEEDGQRLDFQEPDQDDDNSNAVKFISQKRKRCS